jgi:hypothetical protein
MRIDFEMVRLTDHVLGLYLQYVAQIFGNANGTFGEWLLLLLTEESRRRTQARLDGTLPRSFTQLAFTVFPSRKEAFFLEQALMQITMTLAEVAAGHPERAVEFTSGSEFATKILVAVRAATVHAERIRELPPS